MMIELAQAALKKLEIDFAGRIYRHLGDIGMVWSLNEIRTIEDKKLLSGHVAMILGDYNLAANLYLQSGKNFLDTKTEGNVLCKLNQTTLLRLCTPQIPRYFNPF